MLHWYIRLWATGPSEADQRSVLSRGGPASGGVHVDGRKPSRRRKLGDAERDDAPVRTKVVAGLAPGDTLAVACAAALGNSVEDVMRALAWVADKGATVFDAQAAERVDGIAGAVAFAERAKRQLAGMRTAPASRAIAAGGVKTGPAKMALKLPHDELLAMWRRPDLHEVHAIAEKAGCSQRTLYNTFKGVPRWTPAAAGRTREPI